MPSPYIPSVRVKYPKPANGKNRQLNIRVDEPYWIELENERDMRGGL